MPARPQDLDLKPGEDVVVRSSNSHSKVSSRKKVHRQEMHKWVNSKALKLIAGESKETDDPEPFENKLKNSQSAMIQAKKKSFK